MSSRLEQIIDEIEDFIADCKPVIFSSTQISVNRDEMEELIKELRLKTPDEIKKYQRLISNKEAILADANEEAQKMLDDAKAQTQQLINEHEIMQRAYEQANGLIGEAEETAQAIVDKAVEDANNIRMSAIQYTDDMLSNLQMIIEHSIADEQSKYEGLITALNKDLSIIISNRNDLRPGAPTAEEQLAEGVAQAMADTTDEEYDD